MKLKWWQMALCLSLAVPALAAGPEGSRVSADDMVAEALLHSPLLKAAKEEVRVSGAQRDQADARRLPSVDVDARASRYEGLQDSSFSPTAIIPAIEDRYSASVTLTEPLYTGGRISSQRRAAESQEQGAQLDARSAEADLMLRTLQTYWRWAKAYYSEASFGASVKRMEQHDRDMANLREAGLATDNDALATEVLMEQTRLRLAAARRAEESARANLAYLVGRELPADSKPDEPAVEAAAKLPGEEALLQAAYTNRPELAARRMRAEAARSSLKSSKADFYPHVSLMARYEQARPNNLNIPPEDKWADDAFVGVLLNWNVLDSGLTRAKVRESRARLAQAELQVAEQEERVMLDVREARIALQDAWDRMEVAARVAKSAERNLQAATDLWKNGLARHADVLDAHAQVTDAEFQVVSAKADALSARAALDRAVGLLRPEVVEATK